MEQHEFEQEIITLRLQISEMGNLVENAVTEALRAFKQSDLVACSIVIEADRQVNHAQSTLEAHTFRLLAFQQQLGGSDLYFLTAAFTIISELERLGDGAKGIALLLLRISPFQHQMSTIQKTFQEHEKSLTASSTSQEEAVRKSLLTLGENMQTILHGTLEAFINQDAALAHQMAAQDDSIDREYQRIIQQLMSMITAAHAISALQQDDRYLQRLTYLLWIAHKLERMADHCTNICERIISSIEHEPPGFP
jgi:phosphate transport system protein